ncbi:MAG: 2-oxoacid:acceptor oxidoreductase family protein [candidate division WOR-3 bacterium]
MREIQFAGFGGQGIVLASYILGYAITICEKRNSSMTQSYGPEARGGASASGVVISENPDELVDYPKVTNPDVLVCMSKEAYSVYVKKIKENGMLIYDEDLVEIYDLPENIKTYPIPATRLAEKEVGNKLTANVIMLGALCELTKIVSPDSLKKAISETVKKDYIDLNLKAFEVGMNYAKKFKK